MIAAKVADEFLKNLKKVDLNDDIIHRLRAAAAFTTLVKVTGDFAEFATGKPNKITSKTMPPSAASAIMTAVCGKPVMRWLPLSIVSMNLPQFVHVVRNEPKVFKSRMLVNDFMPVSHVFMRKVEYQFAAIPYVFINSTIETPAKFYQMFTQRVQRGQYRHPPVLGTSCCLAEVQLVDDLPESGAALNFAEKIFFGWKNEPSGMRPIWFDGVVANGVLNCAPTCLSKVDMKAILTGVGDFIDDNGDGTYTTRGGLR